MARDDSASAMLEALRDVEREMRGRAAEADAQRARMVALGRLPSAHHHSGRAAAFHAAAAAIANEIDRFAADAAEVE